MNSMASRLHRSANMTRASASIRAHISVFGPLFVVGSIAIVAACGSSGAGNAFVPGGSADAGAPTPPVDASSVILDFGDSAGGGGQQEAGSGSVISNVTIVPANGTLTVQAGQSVSQTYKVMGVLDGQGAPVDLTSRFVLWVPDNYLVGNFPANGGPVFTSRLPSASTDPAQQGGTLTVEAEALNPGSVPITATTSLTVKLQADIDTTLGGGDAGADSGIPANPGQLFTGTASATRAPVLEYPNDGTMLPPNLKVLDVHWMPGSTANTLYQISFTSPTSTITYYSRCGAIQDLLVTGACGFQLDATGYAYLSASNAGQGNVALTIRGTDDAGSAVGTSQTFNIQFAEETVNGGVYYWDVTDTQIMRFDFGGTLTTPDVFFAKKDYGTDGTCVGCHAISPDGTKMVASEGGQNDGRMDYIGSVATVGTPLTQTQSTTSRVQFAAFDPLGTQFVSVDADGQMNNGGNTTNNLWFHDGTTGLVDPTKTKQLSFEPDHPAWSPDGTMIAMTHVGAHNTSQREYLGGIDVATFAAGSVTDAGVAVSDAGASLSDPVVVVPSSATSGTNSVNSYNPSFAPDSTFLVFSQTICATSAAKSDSCDSDIEGNVSATTWAVKPAAGATPLHLDNAAKGGVADGANPSILDTFPRATPFETKQGTGKLFWFTVASLRQPGLRRRDFDPGEAQQQLWMFAVDPAKVLAGQDGSFTAFFLPFQDPKTSNHIAEWTQKIVGGTPAPPVPPPPPPPPPPAPPPPK
jgi:hypothetical protein